MLKTWISKFPEGVFTTNGKIILCQPCNQQVPCTKYSQLTQHVGTNKHTERLEQWQQNKKEQQFLHTSFANVEQSNPFIEDLCDALVGANIPFNKLQNSSFNYFLSKYTNRRIPDESTIRKNYLKISYRRSVERMKQKIGNGFVWISVDETTDKMGRYVCNLLIGKMTEECFHQPQLIAAKILENTNFSTVSRMVNNELREFGIQEERVLLLLSDAAPYMLKAGRALQVFYPNLIHLTCIAHGLNRVSEQLRSKFPDVDRLISNVKKIFLKSPSRVKKYKEMFPKLALPPMPIITRWSSWMDAAIFYANNFESVKAVVENFDPNEAASISISQELFAMPNLACHFAFIKANYSILPESITKLQAQGLTLAEQLNIIASVNEVISKAGGPIGEAIQQKLEQVKSKNPGFTKMIDIAKVLTGGEADLEMAPNLISAFKFAPMTSCDVERSFSIYKNILADNRTNFTPENLEMYLICNCEQRE